MSKTSNIQLTKRSAKSSTVCSKQLHPTILAPLGAACEIENTLLSKLEKKYNYSYINYNKDDCFLKTHNFACDPLNSPTYNPIRLLVTTIIFMIYLLIVCYSLLIIIRHEYKNLFLAVYV